MGENKIYDTSVIIELVKKRAVQSVSYVSIITVVEYPPALEYAEVVLYPTRLEYLIAVK